MFSRVKICFVHLLCVTYIPMKHRRYATSMHSLIHICRITPKACKGSRPPATLKTMSAHAVKFNRMHTLYTIPAYPFSSLIIHSFHPPPLGKKTKNRNPMNAAPAAAPSSAACVISIFFIVTVRSLKRSAQWALYSVHVEEYVPAQKVNGGVARYAWLRGCM